MGRRLTKWSGRDRCHSGGFLLRIMPPSWQPVPACTRNGHSAGGQFINAATNAAGGPFNTATTGFSRRAILLAATTAAGGTAILCDEENWNRMRHRSSNDLQKAGRYTCRHDGIASILDFKPRLRLVNRCSKEAKTGAIRASILDFRPRIENRCSQKVKTGAIRAAHLQHAFHHALTMRLALDV